MKVLPGAQASCLPSVLSGMLTHASLSFNLEIIAHTLFAPSALMAGKMPALPARALLERFVAHLMKQ